ncbi:hypothetical protein ACF0H5_021049 [Mactra antiquata]
MRLLFLLGVLGGAIMVTSQTPTVADLQKEVDHLQQTLGGLSRQMMLQQLFVEERIRSDGGSGVKQIRNNAGGSKTYYHDTFAGRGFLSVHEHSNYDRTIGLGEFIGVLNGVEFRTRHNDYKLKRPSTTSSDYHKTEDIPFPDVPPSVLNKKTVAEQVTEMQEYFRAFHNQDIKIRDYRPYFKPVLCYVEGAWTTNTKTLDEPFQSDRHFIDATSWFDLQEKIRFMSATGSKNQFENLSYLPTTIINVTESGEPVYAQWNYRILCHPIKYNLKLADLKPVDDLSTRMNFMQNMTKFARDSKGARFTVAPTSGNHYTSDGYGTYTDSHQTHVTLDKIMNEIPGVDNYPGKDSDDSFGLMKNRIDIKEPTQLNTAYYYRHYKVQNPGAMGLLNRHVGYSDPTLWTATTKNPKVAAVSVNDCTRDPKTHKMGCKIYTVRSTYAIPLEIIWMTPLSKWNPHNLKLYTNRNEFHKVTDGGRNGGVTAAKAFNGTSFANYYLTPSIFFHGGEANRDPADTAKDVVGVLDQHGQVQRVSASGYRIFTPEIPNVGKVRIRYPIAPAHQEGGVPWKNLMALQDIVMDMKKYEKMFEAAPAISGGASSNGHKPDTHYITSTTHDDPPGMHVHDVYLTEEEMTALKHGATVSAYTTEDNGHQHELVITMDPHLQGRTNRLKITTCDGLRNCWDHHNNALYVKTD